MTAPESHADYLERLNKNLRGLQDVTVRTVRGGSDNRDLDDLTDKVAERLGRRLRREGLLT